MKEKNQMNESRGIKIIQEDDLSPMHCPHCNKRWYDPEEGFDFCQHVVFEYESPAFYQATPKMKSWLNQLIVEGNSDLSIEDDGTGFVDDPKLFLNCPHLDAIVEVTGASCSGLCFHYGFAKNNEETLEPC